MSLQKTLSARGLRAICLALFISCIGTAQAAESRAGGTGTGGTNINPTTGTTSTGTTSTGATSTGTTSTGTTSTGTTSTGTTSTGTTSTGTTSTGTTSTGTTTTTTQVQPTQAQIQAEAQAQSQAQAAAQAQEQALSGQVITRTSSWTYDSGTGMVLSETVQANATSNCVSASGDNTCSVTTSYKYDAYGNKILTTVTGTSLPAALNGSAQAAGSRTTSTTYDTQGEFALTVTNGLGQSESYTYDARFGVPLSHTGPNGVTTNWGYDSLGRKSYEALADGTYTEWGYFYGQYNSPSTAYMIDISHVAYNGSAWVNTAPPELDEYDSLGRPIMNWTQVPSNGSAGYAWTVVTTAYNANGQVASKTLPNGPATTYAYDILGRVISTAQPGATQPNGTFTNAVTTYAYSGLTSTVTDPLGHSTITIDNMMGQVASVEDANNSVLSYAYDALGNLTTVTDPNGNVTSYTYDIEGRKIQMVDPDRGTWNYAYDALGEMTGQTDAKGQTTTIVYDALGRILTRTQPDQVDSWVYDYATNAGPAVGKVVSETSTTASGSLIALRQEEYDSIGRPTNILVTYPAIGSAVGFGVGYNALGTVDTEYYPDGFHATNHYSAIGTLASITATLPTSGNASQTIWTFGNANGMGQITQATLGSNIVVNNSFDPNTGLLTGTTASLGGANIANFSYQHDNIGNLTQRSDAVEGYTENFTYDGLYRLVSSSLANPGANININKTIQYDALGDITYRSDVGNYNGYGPAYPNHYGANTLPHAVQSITNSSGLYIGFIYDNNGNMTAGDNYTATWTSYNMVSAVQQNGVTDRFVYDAGHSRAIQTETNGSTPVNTTYYFNDGKRGINADVVITAAGLWTWHSYVYAGGAMVAENFYTPQNNSTSTSFMVNDHLGSPAVIAQDNSAAAGVVECNCVQERDSYDAWGKRRNANGADDTPGVLTNASTTTKAFTGQEQTGGLALMNYNARMYDPVTGKFLSADPDVELGNLQAMNPYSYVLNNPLSNTDPTGMKCHGWFSCTFGAFAPVVDVIILAVASSPCAGAGLAAPICIAGVVAGVQTGIGLANGDNLGRSLELGVITGAESGAFAEVGSYVDAGTGVGNNSWLESNAGFSNTANYAAHIVGDGLVGGLANIAEGSSFQSGFLAAGFQAAADPYVTDGRLDAQSIAGATISGGIGSVLGGGKFANGAETGAFGYLYNSEQGRFIGEHIGQWVGGAIGALVGGGPEDLPADFIGKVVGQVLGGDIGDALTGPDDTAADDAENGCGCFVAGTLVETKSGLKPIEKIKIGDFVWSRDGVTGRTVLKAVTALIRPHNRLIYEVRLKQAGSGQIETFDVTDDHPWMSKSGHWLTTLHLVVGGQIQTESGEDVSVVSITDTGHTANTYNLEVADFHSYFVGTEKVWVHNACLLPTTPLQRAAALANGWIETNYFSQGRAVFFDPNTGMYYTVDQTGHIGGVWKGATSVSNLSSKTTRSGTYDQNLKRIGD